MNTLIWGPFFWAMLIELSRHVHQSPVTTRQFLLLCHTLHHVLPCIYCRRSSIGFLQKVDLRKYVKGNRMPEAIYRLKECVNEKLHNQDCPESYKKHPSLSKTDRPVSQSIQDNSVCRPYKTKLSLELYLQRLEGPQSMFYEQQFWSLLTMITLNQISRRKTIELHEAIAFSTFVSMLGTLLPIVPSLKGINLTPLTKQTILSAISHKPTQDMSVKEVRADPLYLWLQKQKQANQVQLDDQYFFTLMGFHE